MALRFATADATKRLGSPVPHSVGVQIVPEWILTVSDLEMDLEGSYRQLAAEYDLIPQGDVAFDFPGGLPDELSAF